ncbi:hypothetical protein HPB49_000757 [Dermacentor silvarum]|uniref:Uncharacterized protein n=1 Tax=Dermacentor silvarum TaxID=543639 RepID=A0ACB8CIT4_DERSI|nr:hypothetical protein HPB49_000757 [Dermacentor silvarum]
MFPVVAMLSLIYLVALSSARAPSPRTLRTTMAPFTRQFSDLPDYDTYRFVERLRSEQARQLRAGGGRTNVTSRGLLLPRMRPKKPIWLLLGGRSGRQDRGADDHRRAADDSSSDIRLQVLQFMQDHQLIFYIACSCVLTGVVLLVTLMVLYGGRRGSDARSGMYGESYALLDRRPLLGKRGSVVEEYSDDEEETAIDGDNARGRGAGRRHPSERLCWFRGRPRLRDQHFVRDRCRRRGNQLVGAGRCQDRSKWLAHGHHSEVFEVASPLKRTVLKVIPVTGDFTEQRIDAIAAGHRVLRLRSAVQGRSLVLQASCCLAVAERALGFRHLGVNPDKLLVTATDAASLEYHLPDRSPLTIDSAGLRVHVAGCLSFALGPEAKEEDGTPSSPPRAKSALSNATSHRSSEAQRFKGNVAWLGAVVDSVVRKLRTEVPESRARAERGLVEELSMLQRRLQQCDSVGEFFDTLSI